MLQRSIRQRIDKLESDSKMNINNLDRQMAIQRICFLCGEQYEDLECCLKPFFRRTETKYHKEILDCLIHICEEIQDNIKETTINNIKLKFSSIIEQGSNDE